MEEERENKAKAFVDKAYQEKTGKSKYMDTKTYGDYREMLLNKDIDAVMISTPDHWHSQPAMEAALAGKDIYLQKPTSLTVKEGQQLLEAVQNGAIVGGQDVRDRVGLEGPLDLGENLV